MQLPDDPIEDAPVHSKRTPFEELVLSVGTPQIEAICRLQLEHGLDEAVAGRLMDETREALIFMLRPQPKDAPSWLSPRTATYHRLLRDVMQRSVVAYQSERERRHG